MYPLLSESSEFAPDVDDRRNVHSITVTEVPNDGEATGLFGGVLSAYRSQGFDAGYSLATHEVRGLILLATAEFIRDHGNKRPEVRQILCEFQAYLDQRLSLPAAPSYLEGGLSI